MAERLSNESYFIAAAAIAGVTAYLREHPGISREDITTQEVVVFSQEERPDKLPTRGTPISPWKGLGWTGREHPSAWKDTTRTRQNTVLTPSALGRTRLLRG